MIKHSIVMITYNQESFIGTALDSVLNQDTLPYEILISDDCSTDSTFNIITEYQKKYPVIIKAYQNKKNLGVFGNWNFIYYKATGDVMSILAGDDFYKPGLLTSLNKQIEKNNLDPHNESFIVLYNTIHLHGNQRESLFNNYQIRNNNLFKERLRYGLSFREVGISAKLWHKVDPIREDLGWMADWIYGFDQIAKCDKFYFVNEAYAIYRLSVGVTTNGKPNPEYFNQFKKVIDIIQETYKEKFDSSDRLYIKYKKAHITYLQKNNFLSYFTFLYYYLVNIILNNGSVNNPLLSHWKDIIPYRLKNRLHKLIFKNKYS